MAASGDSDAELVAAALGISTAEAEQRRLNRPRYDGAVAFVQERRSAFGGAYFDDDGVLTILSLPGENGIAEDQVAGLIPSDLDVRWVKATYSAAELYATMDTLVGRRFEFSEGGTPIASIVIDIPTNVVVLRLAGPISRVEATLAQEFGSKLDVRAGEFAVPEDCTGRATCTPWRGGIALKKGYSYPGVCTWGYTARQGTSNIRMITAGHCGNSDQTWWHWHSVIGTTSLNLYWVNGVVEGDVQKVPTSFTGAKNTIYRSSTLPAFAITAKRPFNQQLVGDEAVKSGITTGVTGGQIVHEAAWACYRGGAVCSYFKGASYISDSGDSGAPVFSSSTALGIHSGYLPGVGAIYSTVDNAESGLGVTLCLNANCT